MKKRILVALMVTVVLAPAAVLAMDHSKHGEKMDHSKMDHSKMDDMDHKSMNHDGMGMQGDNAMLGTMVVEGVRASSHIKDVSAAMSKMGMETTHHLMVGFANAETNAEIKSGTVAVKVKGPDDKEMAPVKLMGMHGQFGADLALKEKGVYHFYVGSKLEDGVKRQFHFHTEVK